MALRTGFKRFLWITLIIVVVIGLFVANKKGVLDDLKDDTTAQTDVNRDRADRQSTSSQTSTSSNSSATTPVRSNTKISGSSKKPLRVMTVAYPGQAPIIWANNGLKPNKDCFFYREFGIEVELKSYTVTASVPAFVGGEVDLIINTGDVLPVILERMGEIQPFCPMATDCSRGGDQWVVPPDVLSVSDLKGRSVAMSRLTPSVSLAIYALDYEGKPLSYINPKYQIDPPGCTQAMIAGRVDGGALVWSPDQFTIMAEVDGAHPLFSTLEFPQLIRNVYIGKRDDVDGRGEDIYKFIAATFAAIHEVKTNQAAWNEMTQVMASTWQATGLPWTADDWSMGMNDFYLSTFGDNLRYFGLTDNGTIPTMADIYNQFNDLYTDIGEIRHQALPWEQISETAFLERLKREYWDTGKWRGDGWDPESLPTYTPPTQEMATQQSFMEKAVSVTFATNSYFLDDVAQGIVKRRMADPLRKAGGGSRVKIVGHTDDTGDRMWNMELSEKRAYAVKDYLVSLGFDPNMFICVGFGPDDPVATNSTEDGRRKNRRTEFHLLAAGN